MAKALATYYKFRGLYNSSELERVLSENRVSGVKVTRLQEKFNTSVKNITGTDFVV